MDSVVYADGASQRRCYASLKPIRQWHTRWTPI